jgi:hypothetical protein
VATLERALAVMVAALVEDRALMAAAVEDSILPATA